MSDALKSNRGVKRKLDHENHVPQKNGLISTTPSKSSSSSSCTISSGVGEKLRKQLTRGLKLRSERNNSGLSGCTSSSSVKIKCSSAAAGLKKCLLISSSSPDANPSDGGTADPHPISPLTRTPVLSYDSSAHPPTPSSPTLDTDDQESPSGHENNGNINSRNPRTSTSSFLESIMGSSSSCSPTDRGSLTRLREAIFHISMGKLSRYRHIPDPSLLKSVMICNTLKSLERELEKEGIKVNFGPNGVYFVPPVDPQTPNPTPADAPLDSNQTNGGHLTSESSSSHTFDSSPPDDSKFVPETGPSCGRMTPFLRVDNDDEENDADVSEDDDELSNHDADDSSYESDISVLSTLRSKDDHETCPKENETPVGCESSSCSSESSSSSNLSSEDTPSARLPCLSWSSVLSFSSSDAVECSNRIEKDESIIIPQVFPSTIGGNCPPPVDTSPTEMQELSIRVSTPPLLTSSPSDLSLSSSPSSPSTSGYLSSSPCVTGSSVASHVKVFQRQFSVNNGVNEDMFGDIDVSLYDFDLLSPLSPPNMRLAPVSAEELLKSMTSNENNNNNSSSGPSSLSTSSASSQSSCGSQSSSTASAASGGNQSSSSYSAKLNNFFNSVKKDAIGSFIDMTDIPTAIS